jgi:hypothetical protein
VESVGRAPAAEGADEWKDEGPRRSRRVKRPSRDKASQLSQEAAAARHKASRKVTGKRVRKAKLMSISQLIDESSLDQEE